MPLMLPDSTCSAIPLSLGVASLCLLLLFQSTPALAIDRVGDAFLAGYVSSILERDLHWERDSYALQVSDGVATVTLFADDPVRRDSVEQLGNIEGLKSSVVVVNPPGAGQPGEVGTFMGITGETEAFPQGNLFEPLLADPKQPQFFVSIDRFKSIGVTYTMASVGFGETFGLVRFLGSREKNGLQLSVAGALFAQFNMETPSSDLINADYTIGFPLDYRYGDNSLRLRIYHQSSHLGDEFLQSINPPERVNLSFEAVELIYSRDWRNWRVYGGGEYLIHKEPVDLKPASVHCGIEYRGNKPLLWGGRPIAGVDVKSLEEHDWAKDASVKAGIVFGQSSPGQRRLRVLLEWYRGFDPRGQFYHNKVEYYGLGASLVF